MEPILAEVLRGLGLVGVVAGAAAAGCASPGAGSSAPIDGTRGRLVAGAAAAALAAAAAAVGVVAGARAVAVPGALRLATAATAGAVVAVAMAAVARRRGNALRGALLSASVAAAALVVLEHPLASSVPSGPLGGAPRTFEALLALGCGGAVAVWAGVRRPTGSPRRAVDEAVRSAPAPPWRWDDVVLVAGWGALLAVGAALAGGVLQAAQGYDGLLPRPDAGGLAVRAVAAAVVGRGLAVPAALAAASFALAEAVLRSALGTAGGSPVDPGLALAGAALVVAGLAHVLAVARIRHAAAAIST